MISDPDSFFDSFAITTVQPQAAPAQKTRKTASKTQIITVPDAIDEANNGIVKQRNDARQKIYDAFAILRIFRNRTTRLAGLKAGERQLLISIYACRLCNKHKIVETGFVSDSTLNRNIKGLQDKGLVATKVYWCKVWLVNIKVYARRKTLQYYCTKKGENTVLNLLEEARIINRFKPHKSRKGIKNPAKNPYKNKPKPTK